MSVTQRNPWKKAIVALVLAIIAIAGVIYFGWQGLYRRAPLTYYESPEEHFKYGSIGTESVSGIPFWIWVVLPRLFPEKLPSSGGYTSLGLTWEPGNEMPVGLTKETIGIIPRVGMNCAACHVGTLRNTATESPTFLLGAPSSKFDAQRYARFFFDCASDPRFNANFILPEIKYNINLSLTEKLLYRFAVIPATKQAILQQKEAFAYMNSRPNWGPGRTDMNPLKIGVLNLPDDGSVGSTDFMAIWKEEAREGFYKHSDGLTSDLHESVLSSALGMGTTLKEINLQNLERVQKWIGQAPSPTYLYSVDTAMAKRGKVVFENNCATCHAYDGARTGTVIPINEVKTDPNRANHWTQEAADGFNNYPDENSKIFKNFRNTDGYTALPLDGIWARAPYLHNGSVPTLAALLTVPPKRPKIFYRSFDLYDRKKVGFISEGKDAQKFGYLFDTGIVGNSNQGHKHGSELEEGDKQDLIEYLKTL